MCSCFPSNGKGSQSFPLQICQQQGAHIIWKYSEQRERMNWFYTAIKMSLDTDHCAVFAWNFNNEISVILDKHRNKHFFHTKDEKETALIQWHSSLSSLVNDSHTQYSHTNWNKSLQCMQPGFSSCSFDQWWFGEHVHFGLSLLKTLIKNSVQEQMWEKSTEMDKFGIWG